MAIGGGGGGGMSIALFLCARLSVCGYHGASPDLFPGSDTQCAPQTHEPRRVREKRFLESVITTLQNGGRALLPVFAIGRAQELLLLLEEHWKRNPDLHRFPIICLSGMAKRCIASYRTFIYQMNQRIQHLNDIENPFDFKHIRYMTSLNEFDDNRPAIVMASPGERHDVTCW